MSDDTELHRALDSDDIAGMPVKDTDEEVLGDVSSLQIDPVELALAGIVVKRGLLEKDVIVGVEYIDRIEDDTVWLNADLTLFIEGRDVRDADGAVIGTVEAVDRVRETNAIKGFEVSTDDGETYVAIEDVDSISSERGVVLA